MANERRRKRCAVIPADLVCRFGELSKPEIRVLCYLYGRRNLDTGQCNPRRFLISDETGIQRPHVTTAIKTLEAKQWILEREDGNFIMNANPPKVTELVTPQVTKNGEKITDSNQKVTSNVVESYENGNSLNKDSEQRFKQQIEQMRLEQGVATPPLEGIVRFAPLKNCPKCCGTGEAFHVWKKFGTGEEVKDPISCLCTTWVAGIAD